MCRATSSLTGKGGHFDHLLWKVWMGIMNLKMAIKVQSS